MDNIKVLVIPTWYPREKKPISGIFFKKQAEGLAKNIDVSILDFELVSIREIKDFLKLKKYENYTEKNVKTFRFRKINYGFRFDNIVKKIYKKNIYKYFDKVIKETGKPDIIHAHVTFHGGYLAYLLSKRYNIPYVVTEHSSFFEKLVEKDPEVCSEIFKGASGYMAVGKTLKNKVEELGKIQCLVVPNYINTEKFKTNEIVDEIKIKDKFNLLNVSLLNQVKNIPMLLEALNLVVYESNIKNIHLHLIGDGIERQNIKNKIEELNLQDYCTMHGTVINENLPKYLNSGDALVISSKKETFCVAGIEAMSCGLPVIATKCGGPQDYVNEENGILVENNNAQAMKHGIIKMISNYKIYDKEKIKKYIEDNYSEKAVVDKVITEYKKVLENK